MPRPPLLLALCGVLILACWALFERGSKYEAEASSLRSGIARLERANSDLTASLEKQNSAVSELEKKSAKADQASRRAAELVLSTLPELHQKDKASGSTPEEANKWLDSLFYR